MDIAIDEFRDPRKRASELGLEPIGDIALLPRGFESDEEAGGLFFDAETSTLRKLLAESGVEAHQPGKVGGASGVHVEKSAAWAAPLIFIGARILLDAPETLSLLLNVVEYFVVRVTRGLHHPTVSLSFVLEVEAGRTYKRLTYEGPPKSLKEVETVIRGITDEQDGH